MKKTLLSIAILVVGTIFVFFSCDKEASGPDDLKKDFEKAALVHTEAMEVCLKAIRSSDIMDEPGLMKLVQETGLDFIAGHSYFADDQVSLAQKMLLETADHLISYRKMVSEPGYKGDYGPYDYLIYTIMEFADELSEEQMELLLTINNIMESHDTAEEIVALLTGIKDIYSQALEEEERWVIYAATAIGIESVSYWNESLDEWMEAILENFPDKNLKTEEDGGWFNWIHVVAGDIGGAIGGATGGAIAGSFAGGIGAGAGAAIGALGGSIQTSSTVACIYVLMHIMDGGGGSGGGGGGGEGEGDDEGSGSGGS
ncbi:MAG: hypothetical protein RG741_02360 [Bacteroidales bacterium]|nr:hypothetical protein [Bacteroidales bacterium]